MADQKLLRRYGKLPEGAKQKLKRFLRPKNFKAGEVIARSNRPLLGVHCVESGVIAVSDESQVDMGRRGILLEEGDTFGEYALVPRIREGLTNRTLPEMSQDERHGVIAVRDMYLDFLKDESIVPFPSGLRALTAVETLYLPADQYPAAAAMLEAQKLRPEEEERIKAHEIVAERVFLNLLIPELVDALRRHPQLGKVPPHQLIELAQRAVLYAVPEKQALSDVIPRDPDDGPGDPPVKEHDWFYLARGQLRFDDNVTLHRGGSFRCENKDGAPGKKYRAPAGGAWVALVSQRELNAFADISYPVCSIPWGAGGSHLDEKLWNKTVLLTTNRDQARTPLAGLAALLANTLQRELPKKGDDRVGMLVVRKDSANQDYARVARDEAYDLGVKVYYTNADDPAEVERELQKLKTEEKASPIFIDAPVEWLAQNPVIKPQKVVFLAKDAFDPVPSGSGGAQIIRCVLLREAKLGDYLAYPPRTVRLAFDNLDQIGKKSYVDLSRRDRESLSRLGRAICDRRVGVALGGGGAWGFAHVALLQQLARVKMPIDIISGVSFGSLAGGFYAAGGLETLEAVVDKAIALQLVLTASSVLPPLVQLYLNAQLEGKRLEYLETPFFPVGLNIQTGEEWYPTRGTVAAGIRAASSLPGFLSPATDAGYLVHEQLSDDLRNEVRAVDGVYINNVPEGVLTREGADFIIASDVTQTPNPSKESSSKLLAALGNLSPFSRLRDSMRAMAFTMKVANERDQGLANKIYRPERSGLQPWEFWQASAITSNAGDSADRFARAALDLWTKGWSPP